MVGIFLWTTTHYKKYCDFNNGDVSSGYGFINSHTLSQCEYSGTFRDMDGGVEKGDVSSRYGSTNRHTDFQHNGSK